MPVSPYHIVVNCNVTGLGEIQRMGAVMRDMHIHMARVLTPQQRLNNLMGQAIGINKQFNAGLRDGAGNLRNMSRATTRASRDTQALTRHVSRAHQGWQRLHMGITATRLALIWIGSAGVSAVRNFGKAAFETADQLQIMQITMERMVGNTQRAGANLNELKQIAVTSPFGLTQVMGLGTALAASNPYFRRTGNMMSAVKTFQDVAAGGSGVTGGKMTLEESMNVLTRNMVRFLTQTPGQQGAQWLGQLSRMFPLIPLRGIKEEWAAAHGKRTAIDPAFALERINQALVATKTKGLSKSYEKTWQAQWSNLRDYMLISASEGMKTGRTKLINMMYDMFGNLDLTKTRQGLAYKLGAIMGDFMGWFGDFAKKGNLKGLSNLLGVLAKAFANTGKVVFETVGMVTTAMDDAGTVTALGTAFDEMIKTLGTTLTDVSPLLQALCQDLTALFYDIGEASKLVNHVLTSWYNPDELQKEPDARKRLEKLGEQWMSGGIWGELTPPQAGKGFRGLGQTSQKVGDILQNIYYAGIKQGRAETGIDPITGEGDYSDIRRGDNGNKEKADALDRNTNALNRNTVKLQEVYDPLMVEGGSVE